MRQLHGLGVEPEFLGARTKGIEFADDQLAQSGKIGADRHRPHLAGQMDQPPGSGDQRLGAVQIGFGGGKIEACRLTARRACRLRASGGLR